MARCHGNHGYDAHRHSGTARRQARGLDGKGQRRTISQLISVSEIFGSRDARSWLHYTAIDHKNSDKDFPHQQHKE
ncbi:hypothetical protein [Nostoc sp.]|uniref:hypothetical protein n=1 Tax=Nostoc sp. TaxID=1180 RepID=UPI002FF640D6